MDGHGYIFLFVVHCLEAYGVSAPGLKFLQHKHVLALIALIFCNLLVIFLPMIWEDVIGVASWDLSADFIWFVIS
jgi:hypothetical protein